MSELWSTALSRPRKPDGVKRMWTLPSLHPQESPEGVVKPFVVTELPPVVRSFEIDQKALLAAHAPFPLNPCGEIHMKSVREPIRMDLRLNPFLIYKSMRRLQGDHGWPGGALYIWEEERLPEDLQTFLPTYVKSGCARAANSNLGELTPFTLAQARRAVDPRIGDDGWPWGALYIWREERLEEET